ncbi:hypothetical protein KA005_66710 [bacterium]|nr:hypothetical protein [bacterium]
MTKRVLASYLINACITLIGIGLQDMEHNIPGIVMVIIGIVGICCTLIYSVVRTKMRKPLPQKPIEYDILDDCDFEEKDNWYRNPVTDEIFCSTCWDDHKFVKHLTNDQKNQSRWVCPKCKTIYDSRTRMWKKLFMKNPRSFMIGRQPEK